MARSGDLPPALFPYPNSARLWLAAVVLFGVGDVATTIAGFGLGVAELNPLPRLMIRRHGILSIVVLKLLSICGCWILWRLVPRPHRIGVPLGLSLVGIVVTTWNGFVVAVVLLA